MCIYICKITLMLLTKSILKERCSLDSDENCDSGVFLSFVISLYTWNRNCQDCVIFNHGFRLFHLLLLLPNLPRLFAVLDICFPYMYSKLWICIEHRKLEIKFWQSCFNYNLSLKNYQKIQYNQKVATH